MEKLKSRIKALELENVKLKEEIISLKEEVVASKELKEEGEIQEVDKLIQCNKLWRMQDLHGLESQLKDGLILHPPHTEQKTFLKQVQHAMHVNALADSVELMTQPFKVFEFEFAKRPPSYGKADIVARARRTGVVHAIISWWVLQLDQEGSEVYSTAPKWVEQCQ
ncbi:hypothetical protein L7F22_041088 [Adiantum nelumboides]|nr:hypothetical protein [Adiantum nelumboides]